MLREAKQLVWDHFDGDLGKCITWWTSQSPLLGNISPWDMVVMGRTEALLGIIRDATEGK